jgi:hypothetical protein
MNPDTLEVESREEWLDIPAAAAAAVAVAVPRFFAFFLFHLSTLKYSTELLDRSKACFVP